MLIHEHLLHTLDDLLDEDYKLFKWYLSLRVSYSYTPIPRSNLQNVSREDTVCMMIHRYGEVSAGNLTLVILRRMNFNGPAEELEQALAAGRTATPSASSSAVAPPAAAPAAPAAMMAQQGGVILAPNLKDSTITTMNINITK